MDVFREHTFIQALGYPSVTGEAEWHLGAVARCIVPNSNTAHFILQQRLEQNCQSQWQNLSAIIYTSITGRSLCFSEHRCPCRFFAAVADIAVFEFGTMHVTHLAAVSSLGAAQMG